MFNKFEFFGAIAVSLIGGMAIGYSKAREKFIEALITASNLDKKEERNKEES